jgi:plastocyanin
MSSAHATAPEAEPHWIQRWLENIPFLLVIGVVLPTIVYTGWSLAELRSLPQFGEAPLPAHAAHGAARAPAAVPTEAAALPEGPRIAMIGMAFEPRTLQVEVGTTVTWVNESPFDHAVASGTPDTPAAERLFASSGDFPQGGTFSHTFDTPGTHEIYCSTIGHYAAGMTMTVTVTEATR